MIILAGLAGGIVGGIAAVSHGALNKELAQSLSAMTGVIAEILYFIFIPTSKWQATPGKKILGTYIITTDGQKRSIRLAAARFLSYIPSSLILGFGFLMIGWTDQKKALHDIICKTRVVHGKPQVRNLSAVFD